MKLSAIALTATLFASMASLAMGQQPVDYRTAYHQAQDGEKPLLVLVTADWCPPCQVMKKTTLPQLIERNAFQNFHFSKVDLGKEEKLGRQLMGTQGIPQLILYEKQGGTWTRRSLVGIQTPEAVEAFMAPAQRVRLAEADATTNK
jgi:thiol:disulfide interchange protein